MKYIFLPVLATIIFVSADVFAQNANQDDMLQVEEIYGEENNEVQTAPLDNDSTSVSNPISVDDVLPNGDVQNTNDEQLMIEENIEIESTIEEN